MLGVLRISKNSEQSKSIDGQREAILHFASMHGYEIVGWAEDPDVSAAKVAPIDRPELGHWMKHRTDEFDGILAWKLDRIVRNGQDLRDLLTWLKKNLKRFQSTEEKIINYNPVDPDSLEQKFSEIFMAIAVIFAEMEIANLKLRLKNMRETLLRYRYLPGGFPPYWLKAVEGIREGAPVSGKILEHDPETTETTLDIIKWFLDGQSLDEICRELNSKEEVVTPLERIRKDKPAKEGQHKIHWQPGTLKRILTNRLLIGEWVEDGQVVCEPDGTAAEFVKGIIPRPVFDKLQIMLTPGSPTRTRSDTQALSGAIECLGCGQPLYMAVFRKKHKKGITEYAYYRCGSAANRSSRANPKLGCLAKTQGIPAAKLHTRIEEQLKARFSKYPATKEVFIPGTGNHEEVTRDRDALQRMLADRAAGKYDGPVLEPIYFEQLTAISNRVQRHEAEGVRESRFERQPTGETIYHEWVSGDWARRRELLAVSNITIRARPGLDDVLEIIEGDDTDTRLAAYADGKAVRPATRKPFPQPATAYLRAARIAPDAPAGLDG